MKRNHRNNSLHKGRAFSLLEVLTALAILALTASGVLFVVNQNVSAAADSAHRLEAFDLARENMERILTAPSVTETVEFGTSDLHPNITWNTSVETFSEPAEGTIWLRAVCAAEFVDSLGETQKVELVHWLTPLTEQQAAQFTGSDETESLSGGQVIEGSENAAQYAEVDTDTIEQWLNNGLVVMSDGSFLRHNLNIFIRSQGNPSEAARAQQVHSLEELAAVLKETVNPEDGTSPTELPNPGGDIRSGGEPQRPVNVGPSLR